jgi:multidrug resistance efflux pump
MHPDPRRIAPIVLVIAILAVSWWYLSSSNRQAALDGELSASGSIEATQVTVAAELGGKVARVEAQQGQAVQAGQVLVRFEDALLQAQRAQAQAALAVAQANYDLVVAGPADEQRQAAIAAAELELTNAQQALDSLYDHADLAAAQAAQAMAAADKAFDLATQRLDTLVGQADQVDIDAAWATLVLLRDKLENAQEAFEPFAKKSEDNVNRAALQAQLAAVQKQYDNAVTRYNNIVGKANRFDLALAQAEVDLARQRLADAQRTMQELKDGPDPDLLALAQRRLEAAQAGLAAARAEASPEQLAVAAAQVEAAQAALQAVQVQLDKLVIAAPNDGVILSRAVEPGEFVVPGAPLVTLARLDSLKITVYIAEDRYGQISLGQAARVTVDSFPGEFFQATVARIADQAEFTPRNVQTDEGRRTTVFAVELEIANPDGRLKPGMPADVVFAQ